MTKLAYASLLLALVSTTASAQSPATRPNVPSAQIMTSIAADSVTVSHWYKQNVYDPSDNKIGEIMDVLVDNDGKAHALIVGVGGFLGVGEKDVAVAFNAVQFKMKENFKWYPVMATTK